MMYETYLQNVVGRATSNIMLTIPILGLRSILFACSGSGSFPLLAACFLALSQLCIMPNSLS